MYVRVVCIFILSTQCSDEVVHRRGIIIIRISQGGNITAYRNNNIVIPNNNNTIIIVRTIMETVYDGD